MKENSSNNYQTKNMNNKITYFLFALLLSTYAQGQTKFESGYFVDKQNKKTNCLIKNNKWLDSPKSITYKLSELGEEFQLDASMINGFALNSGPIYITLTDEFPYYVQKVAQGNPNPEITVKKRTVFLKQIVQGKAALFEHRTGNEFIYAYNLEENGTLKVLLYNEYIGIDGKIRTNNVFRNQLFKNVNCGKNQNIQKLTYTKKSLTAYFDSYNNCLSTDNNSEAQSVLEKPKSKLSVILWAGVQRYDFAIALRSVILDYSKTITPKLGLELENIFPFNNNKWSVLLSAAYTAHTSEARNSNSLLISTFELNRIEALLAARHYMFLNDKSSFFLEAGSAFDFDYNKNITNAGFASAEEASNVSFAFVAGVGYAYNQKIYSRLNFYSEQNLLTFISSETNRLSRIALSVGCKF